MATKFEDSREWLMGDAVQKQWARTVAESGAVVLPIYGMDDVDSRTKAPVLFLGTELLVAPDLLVMKPGLTRWHEVKAKSIPTWRRFRPGPRWEHGIDYSLLEEYKQVQSRSGAAVWIVVHEELSPLDADTESQLAPSPEWLVIKLDTAVRVGDRRPDWPGGKKSSNHGRRGQGGWLWARSEMTKVLQRSA